MWSPARISPPQRFKKNQYLLEGLLVVIQAAFELETLDSDPALFSVQIDQRALRAITSLFILVNCVSKIPSSEVRSGHFTSLLHHHFFFFPVLRIGCGYQSPVGKTISDSDRMMDSSWKPHFSALLFLRRQWEMYLAKLNGKDPDFPNYLAVI